LHIAIIIITWLTCQRGSANRVSPDNDFGPLTRTRSGLSAFRME
jgi:hypothetical protein